MEEELLQPSMIFFSFLLSFTFLWLLWKWNRSNYDPRTNQSPPPSPSKLPILGNLHQLGTHPHRSLRDLYTRHGPLMLLHFGSVPVLIASTAAAAEDIMKKHDIVFSSRPSTLFAERLMYNYKDVSFAPYGEYWRQARQVCVLHLLSVKRVASGRMIREEEVAVMFEKIATSISKSMDLSGVLIELTNDITCRMALGKKYSSIKEADGGGGGVQELLAEFLDLLGTFNVADYIPSLAWINKLNGLDSRIEKNSKDLDDLLERVIEDHVIDGVREVDGSFVDVLLSLKDSNSEFSSERESIKALLLDAFAAGTHTTFTAIDWAMTELIRHPEVMKKAQEESRRTGEGKRMIDENDVERMHYLKMVIKEVLRLHPPLPLLVPRESTEDAEIQGYIIPKKTRVIVNAWAIARDPQAWDRPEEFWPERFSEGDKEDGYKRFDFQMVPFGGGRRGCPGIIFAIRIVELALANLLYGFDWELPEGMKVEDMDMTEATGLTANRKANLVLVARKHNNDVGY